MERIKRTCCLLGLSLFLCGCSGFHQAWRHTESPSLSDSPSSLMGRWEGEWRSEVNGHHGRLRCLISPSSQGRVRTWYHARYRKVLGFSYAVEMDHTSHGDTSSFHGDANLGWLAGGHYTYKGGVTNKVFYSTYHSKHDHGYFRMVPVPQP